MALLGPNAATCRAGHYASREAGKGHARQYAFSRVLRIKMIGLIVVSGTAILKYVHCYLIVYDT